MNDLPKQKLCEIIANPKYGRTLCDEPQRCEGLLRDFCGQYKAEIFVLVTALKEGVAGELLKSSQISVPKEIILARLSKRLQDLGMSNKSARWAVNSWALALGINCQLKESGEEGASQRQELIKNEEYEGKLRQYEQKFLSAVEEATSWKQSAANQQEKLQELEESYKPLKNQLKALEKKAKTFKNGWVATTIISALSVIGLGYLYSSQNQKNNSLQLRFYQLSDKNSSLSSQLDSLKSENKSLSSQLDSLKSKNKSLSKELHTLRNVRDNVNDLLTRYSSTGYTYLRFCNKTSRRISAARAYWDGNGWRSQGWWSPEAGECTEVYIGDNYRGKVYVYGKFYGENIVVDNQWSSGDSSFCAELPGPFDIANSDERDNCSGSGREMVKMSEFPVFPGTNTWNFKD